MLWNPDFTAISSSALGRFAWDRKAPPGLATHQPPAYGGAAMPAHPFDLSGKVTLITGANSGLGFGFADAIARAGGDVVIWGRREDRNADAAERLREHGVRVATDAVDVSDEAAQLRGFARALAAMG